MDSCDVLVIGGGPAGSSCAWSLGRAGFDVVVMDRAVFPRDKVCAGWITPQVVEALELDVDDYRRGRVFQPISAFRTGLIGEQADLETSYDRPVSYGIRRFEFDRYLLERAGARLRLNESVGDLRFDERRGRWTVNGTIETPVIVGAGGHLCPVARRLNPAASAGSLVVAQEAEFPVDPDEGWQTSPDAPELYFTPDLRGYGWCFRKGAFMNVGFGRIGGGALPAAVSSFTGFLHARGRIPDAVSWKWRGHAYFVADGAPRRTVDRGVLLVGDAAGLAYAQSGEGIRPAVESGLMAAGHIQQARGVYTTDRLLPYASQLRARFSDSPSATRVLPRSLVSRLLRPLVPRLFRTPWAVRHVVLDRAFLRSSTPALRRCDAARPGFRH